MSVLVLLDYYQKKYCYLVGLYINLFLTDLEARGSKSKVLQIRCLVHRFYFLVFSYGGRE